MAQPQDRIGTYTLREQLGQGPAAEVWLADGLRGEVALKLAQTEQGRAMLRHEAHILDGLGHPGIVRLEARDPDGRWMAIEYVEGGPIDAWAHGRSPRELAAVLARVADGLAYMHAHGVVHGDLKPSNVLVDADGRPRLIDLGLAWVGQDDAPAGFRGTLGYASPELLQGESPSPRTDIYALGVLAYQLVTGRLPHEAPDPTAQAVLPLQTLPCPPSAWVPALPQQLGELILRMLARSTEVRPADAGLVAAALRTCGEGTPGPIVLGMHRERAALRRMVCQAADGLSVVAVLHGPAGSGRSTLIREATEAARREDMQLLRHQPTATGSEVVEAIVSAAHRRPSVVLLDADAADGARMAARLYARKVPGLIMLRSERPVPALLSLGARHLSPAPLSVPEVAALLEHLGARDADAADLHSLSGGRPGALRAIVARRDLPADISDREREVLLATARGRVEVRTLAAELSMGEHDLLDLVDPLLERGLLGESDDGAYLERLA